MELVKSEKRKNWYLKPDGYKPEPTFPDGHRWAGGARCQAWNGTQGRQCGRTPSKGFKVCRQHGGNSLTGVNHPNFKTGRHILSGKLMESYQRSLADGEQLVLSPDIALLDARINELLERVTSNPVSPTFHKDVKAAWDGLNDAINSKNRSAQIKFANEMNALLDRRGNEERLWNDVYRLTEQRRKLAESEGKRISAAQASITAEQAIVVMNEIKRIILTHVTDEDALKKMALELRKLEYEM